MKQPRKTLKAAALSALAATAMCATQAATAGITLFAVTDNTQVAEQLSFGAGPLTQSSAAYLTTDYKNTLHTSWYQEVALDGVNVDFTLRWDFASSKTMANRFADAVSVGESVTWTIVDGAITQVINGTWRYSNSAGITAARFDTSGTRFSNDDGIWGAGAVVDGNFSSTNCSTAGVIQWGVGNCDGADGSTGSIYSHVLWRNGAQLAVPTTLKNFMYIGAPNDVPVPATALMLSLGLIGLGYKRRKSL